MANCASASRAVCIQLYLHRCLRHRRARRCRRRRPRRCSSRSTSGWCPGAEIVSLALIYGNLDVQGISKRFFPGCVKLGGIVLFCGAPCQCRSPYFCLVFVHCPHFVLLLSRFCLNFVPFLSSVPLLSPFCLQILSFVLFWTRFCPHWSQNCPTFVPIWSSQSMENGEDKYWTKLELNHLSIFYLVTLQLDKNWIKAGRQS